jgi:sugar phosphate isomerase/epimerase
MSLNSVRSVLAAVALGVAAHVGAAAPVFSGEIGMVSYTYREQFAKDLPGTLDTIRAFGVRDLEFSNLFGHSAADIRRELDRRGMKCSSFGVSYDDATQKTDEVAANAKTLGAEYVRVAWIPHDGPFTATLTRKTADEFNRIGRILRERHGLTFVYHNHGYEFERYGSGTLFDLLMALTNPADVSYELDILWAQFPGADPAALLTKFGHRFRLMHLKDLRKGVVGDFGGKTDTQNDVALGKGQVDLPAVLRAAREAGVDHYYIEDESPNIAVQVPQSIAYLKKLQN